MTTEGAPNRDESSTTPPAEPPTLDSSPDELNEYYADPANQEPQGPPVRRKRHHRPFSELTKKLDQHPDIDRLRAEAQADLDRQLDEGEEP